MGLFHKHTHTHSDSHQHKPPHLQHAFVIAIVANGLFVVSQFIFSVLAHSTSLLADAVHNLGDVLGLILAWLANRLLNRPPTVTASYGMKKTSILAALINGILLVFTCGIIVTEAIYKLCSPEKIVVEQVMIVAVIGILVNGISALLFSSHSHDLNVRAAFMHLLYDAIISVSVVFSALIIYYTDWFWLDPLMGLLIAGVIFKGTWRLFMDSFHLIIDGVPNHVSFVHVHQFLSQLPGVQNVHDLHIWALSTQENALSVHLWMPSHTFTDTQRQELEQTLRSSFDIHHMTIQVEQSQTHCKDACVSYL
ncbi:MAG: cation diffusion facilitator family transporter [Legionella sp.]